MKKFGADAIFKALSRICIVIFKYQTKLNGLIDSAEADAVITAPQATAARAFVAAATATCAIFKLLAEYQSTL